MVILVFPNELEPIITPNSPFPRPPSSASSILPSVLNNLLANNQAIKLEYEFTEKDFANVNWAEETKLLGSALVELGAFAEVINLDSLSDILLFINNKDFLDQTVHTTENANKLVESGKLNIQNIDSVLNKYQP